jgi:hypothetical protein
MPFSNVSLFSGLLHFSFNTANHFGWPCFFIIMLRLGAVTAVCLARSGAPDDERRFTSGERFGDDRGD